MTIKLLTEHHLEFLRFIGGCRSSSESTLVKMPHCWKSHALAHIFSTIIFGNKIAHKTDKHVRKWILFILSEFLDVCLNS